MGSMETPFELVTCICNSANESAMNQLFNIKKKHQATSNSHSPRSTTVFSALLYVAWNYLSTFQARGFL